MSELIAIRLTEQERSRIKKYADDNHVSNSDVVREAVRRFLLPDYGKGYRSLRELSEEQPKDMVLAFSQFLDDFNHAEDKASLIEEEPVWRAEDAGRWYFDFAAAAHKLANDNGLPVPAWCLKDEYFSDEPYWAFDTQDEEFRAYLKKNTPREFAWHGLYLGPGILERR